MLHPAESEYFNMDLGDIVQSHLEKKQVPYDFIYLWDLINKTKEQRKIEKQTTTDLTVENNLMVVTEEVSGQMSEICEGDKGKLTVISTE